MDVSALLPGLTVTRQVQHAAGLTLYLKSPMTSSCCPACGTESNRVHGYFWRYPQDLTWAGCGIHLWLRVKRFECSNLKCSRATFSETYPDWLSPHAHRTERLKALHTQMGLCLGGAAGAALLEDCHQSISADTVLRGVLKLELPTIQTPRVLGVDDWALRKGYTYGTIVVDLEKHQVVDLLPDRSASSPKAWLNEHPGVEIVARDRASEYSRAVTQACPQAQQVADRFHLVKNLSESVRAWIARERSALQPAIDALKAHFLHPVTSPLTAVDTRTGTEDSAPSPISTRPFLEAVLSVRPGQKSEVEKAASTSTAPPKRWWLQGTTGCVLNKTQEIMFQTVLKRSSTSPPLEALEREMRTLGFEGSSLKLRQRLYHLDLEQGLSQPKPPETVRTRSPFHAHALTRLPNLASGQVGQSRSDVYRHARRTKSPRRSRVHPDSGTPHAVGRWSTGRHRSSEIMARAGSARWNRRTQRFSKKLRARSGRSNCRNHFIME